MNRLTGVSSSSSPIMRNDTGTFLFAGETRLPPTRRPSSPREFFARIYGNLETSENANRNAAELTKFPFERIRVSTTTISHDSSEKTINICNDDFFERNMSESLSNEARERRQFNTKLHDYGRVNDDRDYGNEDNNEDANTNEMRKEDRESRKIVDSNIVDDETRNNDERSAVIISNHEVNPIKKNLLPIYNSSPYGNGATGTCNVSSDNLIHRHLTLYREGAAGLPLGPSDAKLHFQGFSAFLARRRRNKESTPRRQRTTFSGQQTACLELEYRRGEYITRGRRFELAASLALTETQIKIWFQNRRAKDKRIEKAQLDQHYRNLVASNGLTDISQLYAVSAGTGITDFRGIYNCKNHYEVGGYCNCSASAMSTRTMPPSTQRPTPSRFSMLPRVYNDDDDQKNSDLVDNSSNTSGDSNCSLSSSGSISSEDHGTTCDLATLGVSSI